MSVSKLLELGSNMIQAMILCRIGLKKTSIKACICLTQRQSEGRLKSNFSHFVHLPTLVQLEEKAEIQAIVGVKLRFVLQDDSDNDGNILQKQERLKYVT